MILIGIVIPGILFLMAAVEHHIESGTQGETVVGQTAHDTSHGAIGEEIVACGECMTRLHNTRGKGEEIIPGAPVGWRRFGNNLLFIGIGE